jgi:hypothetical protein
LARKPFVVIDAEILSSSVWSEAAHVKLVWLTLLILCDTEGYVGAAIPGIARAAGVALDQTREALSLFMRPDPDSRTQAHQGRRIEPAERGFRILNFREHLDRLSAERRKTRDRVRKFRARKREQVDGNVTVPTGNREQGTGTREQTEGRKPDSPALPPADQAERAIQRSTDALRTRLYGLVTAAVEADPKQRDPTELMRLFTSYSKGDGTAVRGVLNAHQLTHERLERSIKDAEEQIQEWKSGQGQPAAVQQQS